ncbi:AI-2E family transporter [Stenotrophomonas mori]|uniref:AI-2E family transporter n=1 Tax=Stenotrophomonas mori TaxID=2871096 RepID=A0ABT0SKM4_9GAMM|nr:AI-2E family transporter [Stenotrophomonas mori]MCL7715884.1 AI-2E family transporter [Stenotrophomonas mori]
MALSSTMRPFVARVLVVLALLALAALVWTLSDLVLVMFGAVVVAVLLNALVGLLVRFARLPQGVALGVVLLLLLVGFALLMWLFGAQVAGEMESLKQTLPQAWSHFTDWLDASPIGPMVQQGIEQLHQSMSGLAAKAGALAFAASGNVTDMVLMAVGGIYLAAQPRVYREGALKLFPSSRRALVGEALDASGTALRAWLGGQLLAMLVIGLLTGISLWLLDVPVALGLGIITALLDFVPIVGPIVAAIPAILLGFTVSPQTALGVLVVFIVLQQLEGHVLQPLIQQRAVDLPPALLLFSLFGIGALFGVPGILLAAPMTVVIYVLVKRLYVKEALGTDTPIPGQPRG